MRESPLPIVLVLGHRFRSLETERAILAGTAEVVDGNTLQEHELLPAMRAASVVMVGTRARLSRADVAGMSRCSAIIRYGIGVDNIAVDQATGQGIVVVNIPDYCADEVSDHTVALVLAANRRLIAGYEAARGGAWSADSMQGTARLSTQTVGVLGFGRIGRETARKLKPLVAQVLVYDPFVSGEEVCPAGAVPVDLERLLSASDFVIINCPLTPATHHLFDAATLAKMKPTAWLVNTARGEIVKEDDLIDALQQGGIQGAALDVLSQEPPDLDSPLFNMPNLIVTPHVAWYSREAVQDLQRLAAEQARLVLTGKRPRWVVNEGALPGSVGEG